MAVNSVNFGTSRPYGYNPKTHRFDPEQAKRDFKPGIFDPEAQKRNADRRAKVAKVLLGLSALAAAVVFRKPIAKAVVAGATKVAEVAKPLLTKGLEYAGKAVDFVKDHAQTIGTKVIKFFGKGTTSV